MTKELEPEKVIEYQGRLDQIEASINKIRVPLTFMGELYKLKEHVDLVRGKLTRLISQSKDGNA